MSRDGTKKRSDQQPADTPLNGDGWAALAPADPVFHTHAERLTALRAACAEHPRAALHEIGTSEEGRYKDGGRRYVLISTVGARCVAYSLVSSGATAMPSTAAFRL